MMSEDMTGVGALANDYSTRRRRENELAGDNFA